METKYLSEFLYKWDLEIGKEILCFILLERGPKMHTDVSINRDGNCKER